MGSYIIKTAETPHELIESFKLRHEVFNQEFRGIEGNGLDCDEFDYHFDHLVIVHKNSESIIGTYRLNCSTYSKASYTALEFDLDNIFSSNEGPFLELGRACIHKDYRKGSIISLLWRGIAEYMKLSGSKIMFGCSSLKTNNPREAALVHQYLIEQGSVANTYSCQPTPHFTMNNFDIWFASFQKGLDEAQKQGAEGLIPSLLRSYLKLGAKIACEPAFDADFDCIDMLTVLHSEDLAKGLGAKFQVVR